jgi:hypothetical protein
MRRVVHSILGHKDAARTLNIYAGLFPDPLGVVADALEAARTAALGSTH